MRHYNNEVVSSGEILRTLEPQLREIEEQFQQLLLLVPNIPGPDEPIGESEKENVELRTYGNLPSFDFAIRDHIQLLEMHNWAEFQHASKIAGPRSYILKDQAVFLNGLLAHGTRLAYATWVYSYDCSFLCP